MAVSDAEYIIQVGNRWTGLSVTYLFIILFISRFVHIEYIQVLEQKDIASPTRFNHLVFSMTENP